MGVFLSTIVVTVERLFWFADWLDALLLEFKLLIEYIDSLSDLCAFSVFINESISSHSSSFCSIWLSLLLYVYITGLIYFKFVKFPNSL